MFREDINVTGSITEKDRFYIGQKHKNENDVDVYSFLTMYKSDNDIGFVILESAVTGYYFNNYQEPFLPTLFQYENTGSSSFRLKTVKNDEIDSIYLVYDSSSSTLNHSSNKDEATIFYMIRNNKPLSKEKKYKEFPPYNYPDDYPLHAGVNGILSVYSSNRTILLPVANSKGYISSDPLEYNEDNTEMLKYGGLPIGVSDDFNPSDLSNLDLTEGMTVFFPQKWYNQY